MMRRGVLKAGEIVTLARATGGGPIDAESTRFEWMHTGNHSDESYAKADATGFVAAGSADVVLIVKVIAVARRSAVVDE